MALFQRTLTDVELYDPMDVMYHNNPELGSLVYANRAGLLDDKILPYIAGFRKLQHDEKLALMDHITQRMEIASAEERDKYRVDGQIRFKDLHENGMTRRVTLQEGGLTERAKIQANSIRDIQKTKYEIKRQIVKDYVEGQKYISDNECMATKLEAEALRDAIMFTEGIRADVSVRVSEHNLIGRVREAEIQYAARIKEAEALRDAKISEHRSNVAMEYIRAQCFVMREMIQFRAAKLQCETDMTNASYRSIVEIARNAMETLKATGRNGISIDGLTDHGNINLDVRLD